jgi:lantibiotic modifying enzyme
MQQLHRVHHLYRLQHVHQLHPVQRVHRQHRLRALHVPVLHDVPDVLSPRTMELATPEALAGHARALGERVLTQARELDDGSLSWGRGYGVDFGAVDNAGLFNGRIGEALFFAALFAATREPAWERASLRASQGVRAALAEEGGPARLARQIGLGLTGVGSLIYAFTRMSGFLHRPALLDDAARAADALTAESIQADRKHEVFWGAAGSLLGVLALAGAGVEPEENLRRARACAGHLIENRTADPETGLRAWATSEPVPSAGFAHGSSGIAHALLQLYRRTGDPALYAAAFEAFAFERALYRPELRDWPDTRTQPADELISGWCHGATGIGLSRLSAIGLARPEDEDALATDLGLALERTSSHPVIAPDNLCCGNLGRVDFLLEAGLRLGNASLVDRARGKAQVSIDRAAEHGWLLPGSEGYEEPFMEPGLWQGAAGIGYELLRLADPRAFPCLLLLA